MHLLKREKKTRFIPQLLLTTRNLLETISDVGAGAQALGLSCTVFPGYKQRAGSEVEPQGKNHAHIGYWHLKVKD